MLFHFPKNEKQIACSSWGADSPTKTPPFAPFPDISRLWLWVPAVSHPYRLGVLLKSDLPTSHLTKSHKGTYFLN